MKITKRFSDKEYLDVVHQPDVDLQFAPMSVSAEVFFKEHDRVVQMFCDTPIQETNK